MTGGAQQPDRDHAEVLEDLSAQTDLTPLPGARFSRSSLIGFRDRDHRHARRAVAQNDQHSPALGFETLQRPTDGFRAAENVEDKVGAMQPSENIFALADGTIDKGHVVKWIERSLKGVASQRADFRIYRKFSDALDQLVARLAISEQNGDINARDLVMGGEGGDFRPAHDGAVVVHKFCQNSNRR